jgi:hypothetical protein
MCFATGQTLIGFPIAPAQKIALSRRTAREFAVSDVKQRRFRGVGEW